MHDVKARSGKFHLMGFIHVSLFSENETLNGFSYTIFIVASNNGLGRILCLRHAIGHGHAQPNFLDHGGIIAAIPYRHDGLKGTWQASSCLQPNHHPPNS